MKIHVFVYTFVYSFSILLVHEFITKGGFFWQVNLKPLNLGELESIFSIHIKSY